MTVEHDAEKDNIAATCTEDGHNYYKATYAFNDKAEFSSETYDQEIPALGHDMQDAITLNEDKHIYQKGCTRDCGYHEYFATSDGSVKAKPDESGYVFTVAEFTLDDVTKYDNMARFEVEHFTYNRTFSHDGWQALYCDGFLPT